ncbi:MAG: hypothetical protein M1553_04775 [Firmicutes bacterium]|nr:hypothetical protein [Bacillota bacterium]
MSIEVVALVGPSGTGKSHRAQLVAYEEEVDAVVDDGLLIKDSKILAGRSAKREATRRRRMALSRTRPGKSKNDSGN